MRSLWAVIVAVALAGCTEVTRVQDPDGGVAYMVDCGSGLNLLDNCRDAMKRTCPDGYQIIGPHVSGPPGNRPIDKAGMFRCTPSAE